MCGGVFSLIFAQNGEKSGFSKFIMHYNIKINALIQQTLIDFHTKLK